MERDQDKRTKMKNYYKKLSALIQNANKLEDLVIPRINSNNTGGVRSSMLTTGGFLKLKNYHKKSHNKNKIQLDKCDDK